jgi:hypothetical protein
VDIVAHHRVDRVARDAPDGEHDGETAKYAGAPLPRSEHTFAPEDGTAVRR